jgi:hypothetical protein
MEEIPDTQVEILDFRMQQPAREGWEAEEVVPSWHRFSAEQAGIYTIQLEVDDRTKTVPIGVLVADASNGS